jgi:hypothetical protein
VVVYKLLLMLLLLLPELLVELTGLHQHPG